MKKFWKVAAAWIFFAANSAFAAMPPPAGSFARAQELAHRDPTLADKIFFFLPALLIISGIAILIRSRKNGPRAIQGERND